MRTRIAAAVTLVVLGAVAVLRVATSGQAPQPAPPISSPIREPSASPVPTGPGSAARAMAKLCPPEAEERKPAGTAGSPPTVVDEVEGEVEDVRGLEFQHPVATEGVSDEELARRVGNEFADPAFADQLERRGRAWQTIGAIPEGTDLGDALEGFYTSQVAAFYNPETMQLVYPQTEIQPTPVERFTLAHELTHALDDQHFDLSRLGLLEDKCRDEQASAALAAIEGSATIYSAQVILRFFSEAERQRLFEEATKEAEAASVPEGTPEFIVQMAEFPYLSGALFVQARLADGGNAGVDKALKDFPVSTEQVIHPEKYPGDVPQPVDVSDYGPVLGRRWMDLDVEQVGEEWLRTLLDLHLDGGEAGEAAAGWDGGIYRAWANGEDTAVVLVSLWDTPDDAAEFAGAMRTFLEESSGTGSVSTAGSRVTVLFASDDATLDALSAATSVD